MSPLRRLPFAVALLACTTLPARGIADEPTPADLIAPTALPDGLDPVAWQASDLDGKWLLYERLAPKQPGPTSQPWIPFLTQEGEWDLIEWIGLASNSTVALEALRKADHRAWVRFAVWQHQAPDTHRFESALESLKRQHGVVRAWLELHRLPAASAGRPARLEAAPPSATDVARARTLAPPYDLERLLAPLQPPQGVAEMQGPRAQPGRVYLHHVRRALAVLRHGGVVGEPWRARLAALLAHPNPEVRREAAHTMAARPPAEASPEALFARLAVPDERPDVRSAVVDALARLPEPAVRLRVMAIALDPRHPGFQAAVSALADRDDGYLVQSWDLLAKEAGAAGHGAWLEAERARAADRLAARSDADWARVVQPMLGLAEAAHAHRVLDGLRGWTIDRLRSLRSGTLVATQLHAVARDEATMSPAVRALAAEALADR